jgi:hypothetical protein
LKKKKKSSHKLPKQQSTNFWSQGILGVKMMDGPRPIQEWLKPNQLIENYGNFHIANFEVFCQAPFLFFYFFWATK